MRTTNIIAALVLLTACPAENPNDGKGDEAATETSGIPGGDTPGDDDDDSTPGDDDDDANTGDDDDDATGDDDDDSADTGTGTDTDGGTGMNDPGDPLDCGGTVYACGDGKDNDGDGLIDLMDTECTGPCDDDESSFATGIPGDNMDCKQDCFFDGNSGQGDDGCIWSLKCDEANPGANIGCEYTGGNNCDNMPPNQDPDCIEFCLPFVPPGCDCFGCCEVDDGMGGKVNIFLNSHPDCSLDNIDACEQCTQSDDCINTCEEEDCELCFGETELPPECDDNMCDFGDKCKANADCPTDWYCLNQCCYPPPPG